MSSKTLLLAGMSTNRMIVDLNTPGCIFAVYNLISKAVNAINGFILLSLVFDMDIFFFYNSPFTQWLSHFVGLGLGVAGDVSPISQHCRNY